MLERKIVLASGLRSVLLAALAVTSIVGCVDEKSEYTVNPDGSGKVVYDATFTPGDMKLGEQESISADLVGPEIEGILQESEGVDTWKDISFDLTDDGAIHFTGTAYFPNINELDIRAGGFSKDMKLSLSRDESGQITIELKRGSRPKDEQSDANVPELSEADLAEKMKEVRLRYNKSKPMMMGILETLKSDTLLHLPGEIEEVSNFKKIDGTTASIKLEGSKMIEGMDKMMADDDYLKQQIRAGKDPIKQRPDDLMLNEMLFGQKAPVRVVLRSDSENLFDYKAEVAAAKKNYDKMLQELGLGRAAPIKATDIPVVLAEPGTVTVGGVRLVRHSDQERGIRPLSSPSNDYTLSLILELPEQDLVLTRGRVEKAVTDTGENIFQDPGILFPKLSADGRAAVFDVQLSVPGEDANGLAELSGVLGYLKSEGTKEIDLGVMDFKEGAESDVEGCTIKMIGGGAYDRGYTRMILAVDMVRGSFKSAKFYREDGTEIEVLPAGRSYSEGRLKGIRFRTKGEFPPRGRIVFEVLDNISQHEIPFKLTNISLLGKPL